MAETETKRLITDLKQRIKARPTEDRQTDGKAKLLHCSFCGKSQHEVAKLIAGPCVTSAHMAPPSPVC